MMVDMTHAGREATSTAPKGCWDNCDVYAPLSHPMFEAVLVDAQSLIALLADSAAKGYTRVPGRWRVANRPFSIVFPFEFHDFVRGQRRERHIRCAISTEDEIVVDIADVSIEAWFNLVPE
jgi:hypothetical protein